MPAAARILRLRSSVLLISWVGFSSTAAVETITEQTMHSENATIRVFLILSLLDTGESPFDIGLHHKVIHQRSKQVGKQDRQHDALWKRRIDNPNQDSHQADQDAEGPFSGIGHRGRYRVGGHEYHAEGKTTGNQVPVPGHGKGGIAVRT